jgi:hypothetical protein
MIKNWLEKTIIGLDLCPFTRKPYAEGKILIEEHKSLDEADAQASFLNTLNHFQGQNFFETALVVFPEWKISFEDFYFFMEDCEDLLAELNLQDQFQLVVFHPDFQFEGLEFENRGNLVNSSPFPLIHILRTHQLDLINMSTEDAEKMSFTNAIKLDDMGSHEIQSHFPWRKNLV